jgi:hypothetical protein
MTATTQATTPTNTVGTAATLSQPTNGQNGTGAETQNKKPDKLQGTGFCTAASLLTNTKTKMATITKNPYKSKNKSQGQNKDKENTGEIAGKNEANRNRAAADPVGLVESVDCRARRPSSQNLCLPGCSAQNRTNHLTPDLKRPP